MMRSACGRAATSYIRWWKRWRRLLPPVLLPGGDGLAHAGGQAAGFAEVAGQDAERLTQRPPAHPEPGSGFLLDERLPGAGTPSRIARRSRPAICPGLRCGPGPSRRVAPMASPRFLPGPASFRGPACFPGRLAFPARVQLPVPGGRGVPYPPPPGVSTTRTSPAPMLAESAPASPVLVPSARSM